MIKRIITDEKRFDNIKNFLCARGDKFLYNSVGSVRKIIHKETEYCHVPLADNKGKGHHISKLFKADVDKWLVDNGKNMIKHNAEYLEQMFNLGAIESVVGQPSVAIDINDCYWKTAYKLGYITERTYIMGKRNKDWKTGRNASIGALCKTEFSVPFKDGKPNYKLRKIVRSPIEYQYVRNHIIGYVYGMFFRLYQEIGNRFYMYLTDCIFTDYRIQRKVEQFFMDDGYRVKSKPVEFLAVDRNKKIVHWHDFEKEKKDAEGKVIKQGVDTFYQYAGRQVIDGTVFPAVESNISS